MELCRSCSGEDGFGVTWKKWVMNCISSAFMSVLINGCPSKPLNMVKGHRQGDPLSFFLFILVTKVLNKMILKAVDKGIIQGWRLERIR